MYSGHFQHNFQQNFKQNDKFLVAAFLIKDICSKIFACLLSQPKFMKRIKTLKMKLEYKMEDNLNKELCEKEDVLPTIQIVVYDTKLQSNLIKRRTKEVIYLHRNLRGQVMDSFNEQKLFRSRQGKKQPPEVFCKKKCS